jgi:hydroxyacylglutathione hydrolase
MSYYVEQLYTACLAEATYYIESEGQAAIIDPLRETEPYLELLSRRGATLRYVIETHFHADFVSSHLDLAQLTGAAIVYGPTAQARAGFTLHEAADGERLALGAISLEVIHTPGHTLESMCLLLRDEQGEPQSLFTGDTLFVGDVGRPDLAVKSDLSREQLASLLYDSIERLKALPDALVVYPGHGAGSACGKQIGQERNTTLGLQKKLNYALQPLTREQFIEAVTEGQTAPPRYFFDDARINKDGPAPIAEVLTQNLRPLSADELTSAVNAGAIILDSRTPDAFSAGFIEGSVSVGLGGQFAIWVGTLFDIAQPFVLVTEPGKEHETVLRLARVGFENVVGYLDGGITSWLASGNQLSTIANLSPAEFAAQQLPELRVLDVRRESERLTLGVIEGSVSLPLEELPQRAAELDPAATWHIHCAGGYRSMIAASLLRRAGIEHVVNLAGGFATIKAAGARVAELQPA